MGRPVRGGVAGGAVNTAGLTATAGQLPDNVLSGPRLGEEEDNPYADLMPPAPPEGYQETGNTRVVQELPGYTFEVDPTGRHRPRERPLGQARLVEEREVRPAPPPPAPPPPPPQYRNPMDMLGAYVSGSDPEALDRTIHSQGRQDPLEAYEGLMGAGLAPGWAQQGGFQLPNLASVRRAAAVPPTDPLGQVAALFPNAPMTAEQRAVGGPDERGTAGLTNAIDAVTLGGADELSELAGRDADQYRRQLRVGSAQSPSQAALGQAAGTIPALALPASGETAAARMLLAGGQGLGLGTVRGTLSSEGTLPERLRHGAGQGALEGLASAGTVGVGEGAAGLLGSIHNWARSPGVQQQLTQAELEARGLSNAPAREAAQRFPGGREGLVAELNRMGAPRNPAAVRQWAEQQVERIGPRIGATADQLTEQGAAVDMSQLANQAESVARGVENEVGGRGVASALRREVVEPWRAQARMPEVGAEGPIGPARPFNQAFASRRHIDEYAGDLPAQALNRASGRLGEARGMLNRAMTATAQETNPALAQQWQQLNREYSVPAIVLGHGTAAERMNTTGGIAGNVTRAIGGARLFAGDPTAIAQAVVDPMIQQQMRLQAPRMTSAFLRRLQAFGPRAAEWARTLESAQRVGGPGAYALANALLSRRDPEYRQAVQQIQAQEGAEQAPLAPTEENPYADLFGAQEQGQ